MKTCVGQVCMWYKARNTDIYADSVTGLLESFERLIDVFLVFSISWLCADIQDFVGLCHSHPIWNL